MHDSLEAGSVVIENTAAAETFDPKLVVPTLPEATVITSKVVSDTMEKLELGIAEHGENYVYLEKKIHALLNLDGLSEVKITEVKSGSGMLIIHAEGKTTPEFLKGIKANIVNAGVTGNKNNIRFQEKNTDFTKLQVNLYGSSLQVNLKLTAQ